MDSPDRSSKAQAGSPILNSLSKWRYRTLIRDNLQKRGIPYFVWPNSLKRLKLKEQPLRTSQILSARKAFVRNDIPKHCWPRSIREENDVTPSQKKKQEIDRFRADDSLFKPSIKRRCLSMTYLTILPKETRLNNRYIVFRQSRLFHSDKPTEVSISEKELYLLNQTVPKTNEVGELHAMILQARNRSCMVRDTKHKTELSRSATITLKVRSAHYLRQITLTITGLKTPEFTCRVRLEVCTSPVIRHENVCSSDDDQWIFYFAPTEKEEHVQLIEITLRESELLDIYHAVKHVLTASVICGCDSCHIPRPTSLMSKYQDDKTAMRMCEDMPSGRDWGCSPTHQPEHDEEESSDLDLVERKKSGENDISDSTSASEVEEEEEEVSGVTDLDSDEFIVVDEDGLQSRPSSPADIEQRERENASAFSGTGSKGQCEEPLDAGAKSESQSEKPSDLSLKGRATKIVEFIWARAIILAVRQWVTRDCAGCQIEYPSQRQHSCVEGVPVRFLDNELKQKWLNLIPACELKIKESLKQHFELKKPHDGFVINILRRIYTLTQEKLSEYNPLSEYLSRDPSEILSRFYMRPDEPLNSAAESTAADVCKILMGSEDDRSV
ncbi:uncharacterized protein LOC118823272 [Colossoma macropomum]|uniref:uncharacterized protein LOC118823272 n=1 Tax=Colossoma macropomum TaxID=42526 RepID=UPI001864C3C5|nr:uncharacterized protein LOC118823272 [Colossoma macropomum]